MIVINRDICISCRKCEEICPCNVIRFDEYPIIEMGEKCWYCMACVKECPTQAIRIRLPPHIADQRYEMVAFKKERKMVFRVLKRGEVECEYEVEVRK